MKLFKLNTKTYEVEFEEVALMLQPFRALWDRDKTKSKDKAKKELAYIYLFSDIKSDYQYITDETERTIELIKDLKLGSGWSPDEKITVAIEFYMERSKTLNTTLYEATCKSVADISEYLRNTKKYLESGDLDIAKVTGAMQKVPVIMRELNKAYKELVKEQQDLEGKSKGAQTFNMFEGGI